MNAVIKMGVSLPVNLDGKRIEIHPNIEVSMDIPAHLIDNAGDSNTGEKAMSNITKIYKRHEGIAVDLFKKVLQRNLLLIQKRRTK